MKTLRWDSIDPDTGRPYTWDSPNLRWGNPAYVLEPGDPGYVPPAAGPNPKKTTRKGNMKHQRYYPNRYADQLVWLENFRNKLPEYAAALGLAAQKVTDQVAACRWLHYVIGSWLPALRQHAKSCTQVVTEAESGPAAGDMTLPVFTAPTPDTGVVPVPAGGLTRLFDLVQEIKQAEGYTEAIGMDLGVIGPEEMAPDYATLQPVLKAMVSGNAVVIDWNWCGCGKYLDQCEIEVDRGSGWQILTFDTTPGYTDGQTHPATATQWKYRAIFRVNDAQVGQWSATVSVMVGG